MHRRIFAGHRPGWIGPPLTYESGANQRLIRFQRDLSNDACRVRRWLRYDTTARAIRAKHDTGGADDSVSASILLAGDDVATLGPWMPLSRPPQRGELVECQCGPDILRATQARPCSLRRSRPVRHPPEHAPTDRGLPARELSLPRVSVDRLLDTGNRRKDLRLGTCWAKVSARVAAPGCVSRPGAS